MGERAGMEVAVISGDRDLLQLATDHVMIRIPKTKKTGTEIENYHAADVMERYLVTPKEFIDVKALQGDTADNIPGVPKIGAKTAIDLVSQYGSVENIYAQVIDATKGITLYDSSTLDKALKESLQGKTKVEQATMVGEDLAKKALAKAIPAIVAALAIFSRASISFKPLS